MSTSRPKSTSRCRGIRLRVHAPTLFQDAYKKLWQLVAEERLSPSTQFLPYSFKTETRDLIYGLQEQEYTRELLNAINQFSARLHRLVLWEEVISQYEENEADELRFEFTRLIVYYSLHQPYEFRSRLIFSATQLCYIRGIANKTIAPAEVVEDSRIDYVSLERASRNWQAREYLLESIRTLNSTEFRSGTNNYRNRTQHRIPPGIDFGNSSVVERKFPAAGGVSYTVGESGPLTATEVIPLLVQESARMVSAFHAFRLLIEEHVAQEASTT